MPIKTMLGDRVACIRKETLTKTESGIIFGTDKKNEIAVVTHVGPLVKNVKVGDTIFLLRETKPVSIDGIEYTLTFEKRGFFIKLPIEAICDDVICIREYEEEIQGGIIIPDLVRKKSKKAVVVSVGGECEYTKKGKMILLARDGQDITIDGIEYTMTREHGDNYLIL